METLHLFLEVFVKKALVLQMNASSQMFGGKQYHLSAARDYHERVSRVYDTLSTYMYLYQLASEEWTVGWLSPPLQLLLPFYLLPRHAHPLCQERD